MYLLHIFGITGAVEKCGGELHIAFFVLVYLSKSTQSISLGRINQARARAFTGRRNSHSGRGEDFLSRQQNFFTETAVTPERKVEKLFPRSEINRHAEG